MCERSTGRNVNKNIQSKFEISRFHSASRYIFLKWGENCNRTEIHRPSVKINNNDSYLRKLQNTRLDPVS